MLAVGMARIFSSAIPGMNWLIKYWYHFAIMFEALFILTTIDAGTRIARFLVQEILGRVWKPLGDLEWLPASMLATALVVFGWGYFIATGSVETIWPMFGMANQLLAIIAMAVVTTALFNAGRGRYAPVTIAPMLFVATTTGSADLVLLANPGTVAATVDLTVYGAQGRQVPPGGSGIVVPAGTQRVVPLAGLVLGEEAPVVRVTASGAPVQAALQSSITRTLVTGGVDQEGAIVGSARSQVVPGVRVTVAPGGNEPTTVARLLAPAAATTATLTVTDAGGKEVMTRQVPLTAGAPAEVELDALPRGVYSVTATAGAPLVAAVWQATGSGAGSDFAWFTAAPALSAATLVAVPSGPSPQIAVANTGADAATVTLEPVDGGSSRRIQVDPGETVTASVTAGATYRLDPGKTPVTASVSFAAQGALAAFSIWPALGTSAPIRVYP
ncbi:MAG: hypothetical protein J0I70_13365 [Microbacterium sp.]|uniref:DUF5719 family protein n=1 Tax=Microbacterium sp. TaxID=51671 RepID=UPI001ACF9A86|nr:DUF5719 family protein [Microbacterium sp.]MBN9175131.1 hypothetical protein [Microbacterium sp.]